MANDSNAGAARMQASVPADTAGGCPIPWWKRLTLLAFMFFLIKGLAWLIVPALLIWWRAAGS